MRASRFFCRLEKICAGRNFLMGARALGKRFNCKKIFAFFLKTPAWMLVAKSISVLRFLYKKYLRLKFFISAKNCSEREMFFHNCRVNFLFECEWIFIFFRNLGAAFRKIFYGCTGREKASLPMFETAFFMHIWKVYWHWKNWRWVMLAAKNFIYYDKNFTAWFVFAVIKKRGLLKKIGAGSLICRNFIFMGWAKKYLSAAVAHS